MVPLLARGLHQASSLAFWRRFVQLNLGLMLFGLGIAVMLRANIGLDPWSVFHEGVSVHVGLSFGRVTQLIGLVLIAVSYFLLHIKPGLGTVLNMLLIGPWVDLYRAQPWMPSPESWAWGICQFMIGVMLVGLASGLYIAARFGAGPRDGFVLGLSARLGKSVRLTRGGLEFSVLILGFLLGGPPGLGTLLFAFTVGIFMQYFLRVFRYREHVVAAGQPAD